MPICTRHARPARETILLLGEVLSANVLRNRIHGIARPIPTALSNRVDARANLPLLINLPIVHGNDEPIPVAQVNVSSTIVTINDEEALI